MGECNALKYLDMAFLALQTSPAGLSRVWHENTECVLLEFGPMRMLCRLCHFGYFHVQMPGVAISSLSVTDPTSSLENEVSVRVRTMAWKSWQIGCDS